MKKLIACLSLLTVSSAVSFCASAQQVQVAFSPGQSLPLVLSVISNARSSLDIAAYSFTSKDIAVAINDAKKRGVKVRVVADKKSNSGRYTAVTFLQNHSIDVCLTDKYAIMHNKFMVVDGGLVETGSFNYTSSAVKRNAENVLVISDRNAAATYGKEFSRLYNECRSRER